MIMKEQIVYSNGRFRVKRFITNVKTVYWAYMIPHMQHLKSFKTESSAVAYVKKKIKSMESKYALFWKGKRLKDLGTFSTRKSAETTRGIEMTQMEFADYTPSQLRKWFKVRKI